MGLTAATRGAQLGWRNSSFCASNECVQIARQNGLIGSSNSTRPRRTACYTPQEWQALVNGLRAGDFDNGGAIAPA
jgi:hypothetical protein